jgi:thiopeptide-type bacteriocin biosynthesis protein
MAEQRSEAPAPSGFFVLRTPLLPLRTFLEWGDGTESASVTDRSNLRDAVDRDGKLLRKRLREIVQRPAFSEAIFVASPTLAAATAAWCDREARGGVDKVELSLVAYLSRAAARPTPFGLFAGCTVGAFGHRAQLELGDPTSYKRHTRLDAEYVSSLAAAIAGNTSFRRVLRFHPNSSLYEAADRVFVAVAEGGATGRSYRLVAVQKSPYLIAALQRARDGASMSELAEVLIDGEVTQADAEAFVDELIESQLLVPDVELQVTGSEPTEAMIATLDRRPETAPVGGALERVRAALTRMDSEGVGIATDRYRGVAEMAAVLPASPDVSRLVQVDLLKPASREMTLPDDVAGAVLEGVEALHRFSRAAPAPGLARFREQFVRRYETRVIPLSDALDEENGIGFERSETAGAELRELIGGLASSVNGAQSPRWMAGDALLLDKLLQAASTGAEEIEVAPEELDRLPEAGGGPLPDAFEALATLDAASVEDIEAGRFRVVMHSVSGPSGGRLLGRFCHSSPEVHARVVEHLRAEEAQRPDAVFAEIVHVPEGRVANIVSRPVLRAFEIPYLGRSGAPAEHQLPISDLLVSVEGDRVVLRSRRLRREVIPRLTTAHNHSGRGLSVYRFLCALQSQGVSPGAIWDWGPLEGVPFLPRVVMGRAVLSRARWHLDGDALEAFRHRVDDDMFAAVQGLRADRRLPRYVALADGENELLTDMENLLSLRALGRQIKPRSSATLVELLPSPDGLCTRGPDGEFTHQLVVPFNRRSRARQPSPVQSSGHDHARHRRFPPGSEWLYVKLYSGPATVEHVLDQVMRSISPLLPQAHSQWFFIRYGDPDWHVRLRVHGDAEDLLPRALPALHNVTARLLELGSLWRVQLDTYEREVERYGGKRAIELAEQIFHADSEAVLDILRHVAGADSSTRWRAALLGMDRLFADFELGVDERRAVARRALAGYRAELGADRTFRRAVAAHYRAQRASIEALLDGDDAVEQSPALAAAIQRRSEQVVPVAHELRRLDELGRLSVTVPELVMSLAHMHVNRMLRSAQRTQELVLYELLEHRYSSQSARAARV